MNEIRVKFSSDGEIEEFYNIKEVKNVTLLGILDIKHKDGARSIIDVKKADFISIGSGVEVK